MFGINILATEITLKKLLEKKKKIINKRKKSPIAMHLLDPSFCCLEAYVVVCVHSYLKPIISTVSKKEKRKRTYEGCTSRAPVHHLYLTAPTSYVLCCSNLS